MGNLKKFEVLGKWVGVVFIGEKKNEVVPTKWITQRHSGFFCQYPPVAEHKKGVKFSRELVEPQGIHGIHMLHVIIDCTSGK